MFSERLEIQQLKYPLDEQVDWLNDPRNTKFSEQRHLVHTKKSCMDYVSSCSMFWGIKDIDSSEWIGTIAAHIDEHNEVAELGILIADEYTGNGYAQEAWNAVCEHLFKNLGIRKIEAGMMAENLPMKKLCERTGMVYEGEKKNHFLRNGHPVSLIQYARWPKP